MNANEAFDKFFVFDITNYYNLFKDLNLNTDVLFKLIKINLLDNLINIYTLNNKEIININNKLIYLKVLIISNLLTLLIQVLILNVNITCNNLKEVFKCIGKYLNKYCIMSEIILNINNKNCNIQNKLNMNNNNNNKEAPNVIKELLFIINNLINLFDNYKIYTKKKFLIDNIIDIFNFTQNAHLKNYINDYLNKKLDNIKTYNSLSYENSCGIVNNNNNNNCCYYYYQSVSQECFTLNTRYNSSNKIHDDKTKSNIKISIIDNIKEKLNKRSQSNFTNSNNNNIKCLDLKNNNNNNNNNQTVEEDQRIILNSKKLNSIYNKNNTSYCNQMFKKHRMPQVPKVKSNKDKTNDNLNNINKYNNIEYMQKNSLAYKNTLDIVNKPNYINAKHNILLNSISNTSTNKYNDTNKSNKLSKIRSLIEAKFYSKKLNKINEKTKEEKNKDSSIINSSFNSINNIFKDNLNDSNNNNLNQSKYSNFNDYEEETDEIIAGSTPSRNAFIPSNNLSSKTNNLLKEVDKVKKIYLDLFKQS